MKKLFNTSTSSITTNIGLLIARIAIAALMLTHGIPKMAMLFSGDPIQFPPVFGMSAEFTLALAVLAEVLCSILILTGFATRLAVLPLIATMLAAILSIHAGDVFTKKELAVSYLIVYTFLFFTGSGKYSVDHLIRHGLATDRYKLNSTRTSPVYQ